MKLSDIQNYQAGGKRKGRRTAMRGDVEANLPISGISFICRGLRVSNALNVRSHWRKRHAERCLARESVAMAMLSDRPWPSLPVTVMMIRVGPKTMDDDGLSASLKHVRDAVAEMLGVDDGDPRIRFECRQEVGKYAVMVSIVSR